MRRVNRFLLKFFFLILTYLLLFAYPFNSLASDKIRINGSGTSVAMMKPFLEAYGKGNHHVLFQMEKSLGSSGAIKALLAGAIDIAVISRSLKPDEINRGLRIRYYGKTPLVIVTEKKVPLQNITTGELEDIYSGKTKKWSNGETIRIILRPNEETDTKIMRGLSSGMAEAIAKAHKRRGMRIAMTDFESIEALSGTAGAIGASTLTQVLVGQFPVNVLALNGIKPGRKNQANRKYPLFKDIIFVTTSQLSAATEEFLNYVYSQKGRAIAEKSGVWLAEVNH